MRRRETATGHKVQLACTGDKVPHIGMMPYAMEAKPG
jgi:hypothetical protein